MLGGANLTTGGGGKAVLTLALEAAFGGGPVAANDQISFGRIRIAAGGLLQGATYKVTHPYGVDTYTNVDAGARGLIHTEDVGIGAPGDFTGALNSRVGPFLTWSDFPNSPGPSQPAQRHGCLRRRSRNRSPDQGQSEWHERLPHGRSRGQFHWQCQPLCQPIAGR